MKLATKIILIFVGVLLLITVIFSVWGDNLISSIGTKVLGTEIGMSKARFIPWRLAFQLSDISLPEVNVKLRKGTLSLVPIRLDLSGAQVFEKLEFSEDAVQLQLSRGDNWNINLAFENIALVILTSVWEDLDRYGIERGAVSGSVTGYYSPKEERFFLECDLYCKDLDYEDTSLLPKFSVFGISSDKFYEVIADNDGVIEIDFTYQGPLDEFDQLFHYRPGQKTISLLSGLLFKK